MSRSHDETSAAPRKAPLTRAQQIKFMTEAPARHAERLERWSRDEEFQKLLAQPADHRDPCAPLRRAIVHAQNDAARVARAAKPRGLNPRVAALRGAPEE